MKLDYLDMMIIHSPQPWDKVNQCDDRYTEGNRAAWRAIEDAYKAGKLRAVGVSNFLIGAGVDGRMEMPSVFDGRDINYPLTHLTLSDVQKFGSGAVWLRYKTNG